MTTQPFRIRSEADVLALVPYTLGFHPVDSLVLVTLDGRRRPFQARIDLPDDLDELPVISQHLVQAALRNGAERALVIVYTDDECLGEAAAAALVETLDRVGVTTLLTIRADGSRWFPVGTGQPEPEGHAYDVRGHELSSRAVLDGKVTFRDRTELVDSLAPLDPVSVEEVEAAHDGLAELASQGQELLLESLWLMELVRSSVAAHPAALAFEPVTTARFLRAVANRDVRDLVWCDITRENAEAHVALWREVVRRSPETLVAPAAGLLAFAAWLAGDGALSWCAVDRCLCADPDHVLGRLVGDALTSAAPPSSWRPVDPRTLALFAG
jgi:Domain of unknown function (DUF4192)